MVSNFTFLDEMSDYFSEENWSRKRLGEIQSLPVIQVGYQDLLDGEDGVPFFRIALPIGLMELCRFTSIGPTSTHLRIKESAPDEGINISVSIEESQVDTNCFIGKNEEEVPIVFLRLSSANFDDSPISFPGGLGVLRFEEVLFSRSGRLLESCFMHKENGFKVSNDARFLVGEIAWNLADFAESTHWLESGERWLQLTAKSRSEPLWASRAALTQESDGILHFRILIAELPNGSVQSSMQLHSRNAREGPSTKGELRISFYHQELSTLLDQVKRIQEQVSPAVIPMGRKRFWFIKTDSKEPGDLTLTLEDGPLWFIDTTKDQKTRSILIPAMSKKLIQLVGENLEMLEGSGTQSLRVEIGEEQAELDLSYTFLASTFRVELEEEETGQMVVKIEPLASLFQEYEVEIADIPQPVVSITPDQLVLTSEATQVLSEGGELFVTEKSTGHIETISLENRKTDTSVEDDKIPPKVRKSKRKRG